MNSPLKYVGMLAVCCLGAGALEAVGCASSPKAKPAAQPVVVAAKETPAERFRRDAERRQREEDERRRREDFMHRNDALRR